MGLQKVDDDRSLLSEWQLAQSITGEALGRLVTRTLVEATESLWRFYNRPLPDGGTWAIVGSPEAIKEFASSTASTDKLLSACLDLEDHSLLNDQERRSLKAAAGVARALRLGARPAGLEISLQPRDSLCASGGVPDEDGPTGNELGEPCMNDVLSADCRVGSTYFRVKVRNFSRSGAMIVGPKSLRVGDTAALKIHNEWLAGNIIWAVAERSGFRSHSAEEPR